MHRPTQIILVLLLLGAAGFGLAQYVEARKLRDTVAGLDHERDGWQKRIAELQKLNADLASRLNRGARAPGAVTTADGPGGPGAPGDDPGGRGRNRWEGGRFMAALNSPEAMRLMSLQQKAGLDSRYAALFKQLNLSPADLDKFKSLLVEKQSAIMDVMAAARAQGLDPRTDRDQIQALVQSTQSDVESSIRAQLGDAAYAQYQGYEATLPQRNVVDQLSQRLSYSATPLSDTQSAQLIQILSDTSTSPANANPARLLGGNGPGSGTRITDTAVAQAQTVLNPQQVSALQSLQAEQQASAQLRQLMRSSTGAPAATPTAATGSVPTPARTPGS